MGLDIAFDRNEAIAAGMDVKHERNGSDGAIQEELTLLNEGNGDARHLAWLQEHTTIVKLPNIDWWLVDGGNKTETVVRANRWGDSFAPVMAFLTMNKIHHVKF